MQFNFIHISDLHFRPDWPEQTSLIVNKFFEDLDLQACNYEKLYLVFSGDLVYSGSEIVQYKEFLDTFSEKFDEIGIGFDKRICVPGNHDVSRTELEKKLLPHNASLNEISGEEQFNSELPNLYELLLGDKFINYVHCEKDFAKFSTCGTKLGGHGWDVNEEFGIYCLNSALCSTGGLQQDNKSKRSDKGKLHIDTRSVYEWVAQSKHKYRILVSHHPFDWYQSWAEKEVGLLAQDNFNLVISGHIHEGSIGSFSRAAGNYIDCSAPPLFTRKNNPELGYSFIEIDTEKSETKITYRQWANAARKFVTGSAISGTNNGVKVIREDSSVDLQKTKDYIRTRSNIEHLMRTELEDALTCHASSKKVWVDRDLSTVSDIHSEKSDGNKFLLSDFAKNIKSCVIKSPKESGLSSLGKYLSLHHYLNSNKTSFALTIDATEVQTHRRGLIADIDARMNYFGASSDMLDVIVVDNWSNESKKRKLLRILLEEYKDSKIVVMEGTDENTNILDTLYFEEIESFRCYYLKSLTQSRIRDLVTSYTDDSPNLDEEALTKKIIADIDALNIHRTPLNCLLLLKLAEQSFDENPVNRTEMISRVMWLLFMQFDKMPTYANRPDRTDCEYALGYFSEWLLRNDISSFLREDFSRKIAEYSRDRAIRIDSQILFALLVSAGIFTQRIHRYEFRFNYWLYFFAAHRMHHDDSFAEYILSDLRYASMPEIIEFYTGIDRRRDNAVEMLTSDLVKMDKQFEERTGISLDFDPYRKAKWAPNHESIEEMKKDVGDGAAGSQLPTSVKDAIADGHYDASKPYRQEIAKFVNESSLSQMVQAMRGSARALRNSDHVDPKKKKLLLAAVLSCWIRMSQTLAVISPVLVEKGSAGFEGLNFYLGSSFDGMTKEDQWHGLMVHLIDNVVRWFHEDIFSHKLGMLMTKYLEEEYDDFHKAMILLVMIRQRPHGWTECVEQFIHQSDKDSFFLGRVEYALREEFKIGFVPEQEKPQLRRLASIALAKHNTGAKKPNQKLIEKGEKHFDESLGED